MAHHELIKELDDTIDRLIENAIALESIDDSSSDYHLAQNLLEQMQESLLAHLLHLDEKLADKKITHCFDYKKIKEFSLENLDNLHCKTLIKQDKIKISKSRLKGNSTKIA